LLLHAVGQSFRLIDLVHGDDDRNLGRVGVIDSFQGLRHHAVIGRDHQHHDIGRLGPTGTHARKCLVTRRVEENNFAPEGGRFLVGNADLVSTDVLRNAPRFTFGDVGEAN